jgi:pilus assembly protein Flp/PilA
LEGSTAWIGECDRKSSAAKEGYKPMGKWLQEFVQFLEAEDGPTAVEYAVMLALIVVVCLAAITAMGTAANKTFGNIALQTATAGT